MTLPSFVVSNDSGLINSLASARIGTKSLVNESFTGNAIEKYLLKMANIEVIRLGNTFGTNYYIEILKFLIIYSFPWSVKQVHLV